MGVMSNSWWGEHQNFFEKLEVEECSVTGKPAIKTLKRGGRDRGGVRSFIPCASHAARGKPNFYLEKSDSGASKNEQKQQKTTKNNKKYTNQQKSWRGLLLSLYCKRKEGTSHDRTHGVLWVRVTPRSDL